MLACAVAGLRPCFPTRATFRLLLCKATKEGDRMRPQFGNSRHAVVAAEPRRQRERQSAFAHHVCEWRTALGPLRPRALRGRGLAHAAISCGRAIAASWR